MLNDSATATTTLTDEERKAIQEQLERLLSNSHFNQSRRFPSFLRFVIDQTLLGQTDLLKERTLGIEIFGREADYDTASDPIVRVTATEIRKRIAQYYQEPGHETELRVSLPAGSYVPQFHWPQPAREVVSLQQSWLPPRLRCACRAFARGNRAGSARGRRFWRPATAVALAAVVCVRAPPCIYGTRRTVRRSTFFGVRW